MLLGTTWECLPKLAKVVKWQNNNNDGFFHNISHKKRRERESFCAELCAPSLACLKVLTGSITVEKCHFRACVKFQTCELGKAGHCGIFARTKMRLTKCYPSWLYFCCLRPSEAGRGHEVMFLHFLPLCIIVCIGGRHWRASVSLYW